MGKTASRLHSSSAPAGGWRLELECQSLDRGRKRTGRSGRGKAPRELPSPRLQPYPAHYVPFPKNQTARQICQHSWLLRRKGRSRGPWGEGGSPEGFKASSVWPRNSPCSTRRTHFPRWFGLAAELVGMRVGRAGWRLPPACNEETTPL